MIRSEIIGKSRRQQRQLPQHQQDNYYALYCCKTLRSFDSEEDGEDECGDDDDDDATTHSIGSISTSISSSSSRSSSRGVVVPAVAQLTWLLECCYQQQQQQQQPTLGYVKSLLHRAIQQALPASSIRSRIITALSLAEKTLNNHNNPKKKNQTTKKKNSIPIHPARLARAVHRAFQQSYRSHSHQNHYNNSTTITAARRRDKTFRVTSKKQQQQQPQQQRHKNTIFTGYGLFFEEYARTVQQQNNHHQQQHQQQQPLTALATRAWHRLSDHDKSYYERLAAKRKSGRNAALYNTTATTSSTQLRLQQQQQQQQPALLTPPPPPPQEQEDDAYNSTFHAALTTTTATVAVTAISSDSNATTTSNSSSNSNSDTETDESVSSWILQQDPEITASEYWGYFLEALQLEILSRPKYYCYDGGGNVAAGRGGNGTGMVNTSTSQCSSTAGGKQGEKKTRSTTAAATTTTTTSTTSSSFGPSFQIYRLMGEAQVVPPSTTNPFVQSAIHGSPDYNNNNFSSSNNIKKNTDSHYYYYYLRTIRRRIEEEFLSLYEGTVQTRARQARMMRDCRVYVSMQPPPANQVNNSGEIHNNNNNNNILWVQINLGRCLFGSHELVQLRRQQQQHSTTTTNKTTTYSSTTRKSAAKCGVMGGGTVGSCRLYGAEYHAVVIQGDSHVAIRCTGTAATKTTRLTRLVLAALEAAMFSTTTTNTTTTTSSSVGFVVAAAAAKSTDQQHHCNNNHKTTTGDNMEDIKELGIVPGLTGMDPLDLLRSASAARDKTAIGRFAMYAARKGMSSCYNNNGTKALDPVSAFESAATGSLLKTTTSRIVSPDRDSGVNKDDNDDGYADAAPYKGCRTLQQLCRQVSLSSGGKSRVVGVSLATPKKNKPSWSRCKNHEGQQVGGGGGIILDHSASEKRQRKRRSEADLGRPQDCPKRSRVRWDVTSTESTAASLAWRNNISSAQQPPHHHPTEGPGQQNDDDDLRFVSKFKCRVVLKGSDVLAGLRALMEVGETNCSLPDCVRDAPSLGGTIRVTDKCYQ